MLNNNDLDQTIERVAATIRDAEPTAQELSAAKQRVWAQMARQNINPKANTMQLNNCDDFRAMIPAYLNKETPEARALLFEDHTRECIPCRKALTQARTGRAEANRAVAPRPATLGERVSKALQPKQLRWALAAAMVVAVGGVSWFVYDRFVPTGTARATVKYANGGVYRVNGQDTRSIGVGEELQAGDSLRTAQDATAQVALADGTVIEVKDRSEFTVSETGAGATIALDKGQVLVEAAKQKNGKHLYVKTRDGLVTVVGTVFNVNAGTKGTRVTVVEGQVRLNHGNHEQAINPGEQATTSETLEKTPVQDEVAWSKNAGKYIELLAAYNAAKQELARAPRPGVRYSSRFLDLQPAGTVLYAALPNLTGTLAESHRIMQERISKNAALREFVEKERGGDAGLSGMVKKLDEFGKYLGEEIVVSAGMNESGEPSNPMVMGELKDANGFRAYAEQQINAFNTLAKNKANVRIIRDPLSEQAAASTDNTFFLWIGDNFFVAAPQFDQIKAVAGKTGGFAGTPFYNDLAAAYREGAGLLVAADLEKVVGQITSKEKDAKKVEGFKQLGLNNFRRVLLEQKDVSGKSQSRAQLTFSETKTGLPAWLAAPGPVGALNYVGPEANVAAAFVVAQPATMVDELLKVMGTVAPETRGDLDRVQKVHGINLSRDVASALGGEFAFAIDGPVLPTPAWKLVLEVNDQAKMQQTLERIVAEVNKEAAKRKQKGLVWQNENADGRALYSVKSADIGVELNYTYADGYLVAAPTRALVQRALQYRDAGTSILTSSRFRSALPADGNANFSALVYHDLAPLVKPLADQAQKMVNLSPEQKQMASTLGEGEPTLLYAYATGERLTIAANTDAGPFGLSPAALFGAPTGFELQHVLMGAMNQKK
jgi:ferric-dicitrate binding protein FerR (iron transport regulator)